MKLSDKITQIIYDEFNDLNDYDFMESMLSIFADRLIFEYEQITAGEYNDYYEILRKGFSVIIQPTDNRIIDSFEIDITLDYTQMVTDLKACIEHISIMFVTDCFGCTVIDEAA